MSKIKIAIAEDQLLFRKGMIALLNSINDFKVIVEGENGADLLEKIDAQDLAPDIFLLDLRMPEMDGIETTEILKVRDKDSKIVIVSAHDDEDIIVHLFEKGANTFIDKNADAKEVELAIRNVYKNGFYINKAAKKALEESNSDKSIKQNQYKKLLSTRELEIIRLICQEKNSAEISEELNLSVRTVENNRYHLLKKTGSKNIAGLILFALKSGIVALADLKIGKY